MPAASRLHPKVVLHGLTLAALALALALAGATAAAEPSDAEAARTARERAGIQAERDRLEAQFAAELARCGERFAVTACRADVRERRRAALEGPRARALALDDAERRHRAAARRDALVQKQRQASERSAPGASVALEPTAATPVPAQDQPQAPLYASSAPASSAAEAAAAQRAAAARRRQVSIQAEQARVKARQLERARQGKRAAPLPVPAASSAAAR